MMQQGNQRPVLVTFVVGIVIVTLFATSWSLSLSWDSLAARFHYPLPILDSYALLPIQTDYSISEEDIRREFTILAELAAKTCDGLGRQHKSKLLQHTGQSIYKFLNDDASADDHASSLAKRGTDDLFSGDVSGFFHTIGDLITGKTNTSTVFDNAVGDAVDGTGILGDIGNELSGAATYLGSGLAEGAITGLGLQAYTKSGTGATVPDATGVDLAAENLGEGMASTFLGAMDLQKIMGGSANELGPAAYAMAQGLGSGSAAALKLGDPNVTPSSDSGLVAIAGNLGLGLSTGFLDHVDLSTSLETVMGGSGSEIGPAAYAMAQGLGSGSAAALKLGDPNVTPSTGSDIVAIAGNLGLGLSTGFLDNVDFSADLQKFMGDSTSQIGPAAYAMAQGLGSGSAAALKLGHPNITPSDGSDLVAVAGNLGLGLSTGFLDNVDLSSATSPQQKEELMTIVSAAIVPAGRGLGLGAAEGLKLSNGKTTPQLPAGEMTTDVDFPGTTISVGDTSEEFTRALASSFLGSIDMSSLTSPDQQKQLTDALGAAIVPAARGLGIGAARGLKLSNGTSDADLPPEDSSSVDIPGTQIPVGQTSEDFSRTLAWAFLGSIDFSNTVDPATQAKIMKTVTAAIIPAGRGLGIGAAEGLKLTNGSIPEDTIGSASSTDVTIPGTQIPVGETSQDFTRALASSFLGSIDTSKGMSPETEKTIMNTVTAAIVPAARGLGIGTANGLGLSNGTLSSNLPPEQTGTSITIMGTEVNVGELSEDFTKTLSWSFLGSVDMSNSMDPEMEQKIMKAIAAAIVPAARGLGIGAAEGLQLSNGTFPTGYPPGMSNLPNFTIPGTSIDVGETSEDFTRTLVWSFLGSVDTSTMMDPAKQEAMMIQVANAIPYVGKGLGKGTANGLGLGSGETTRISFKRDLTTTLPNGTMTIGGVSVDELSEDFTNALAASFLETVDVTKFADPNEENQMLQQLAESASALGRGLGEGASQGLGLSNGTKDVGVIQQNGSISVPSVVENFSKNLASSFLGTAKLPDDPSSLPGYAELVKQVSIAAEGLGCGLGQGAVIGLDLQVDGNASSLCANLGGPGMVTENFAKGLVASFLANDTLGKLQTKMNISTDSYNISTIAEGFARGLVDGAAEPLAGSDLLKTLTGSDTADPSTTPFNDTVDGAATGLGRGFGSETISVILQLFGNSRTPPSNSSSPTKRDLTLELLSSAPISDQALSLLKRDDTGYAAAQNPLVKNINFTAVNHAVQKGGDALTCGGVGGLVGVFMGLQASNTIKSTIQMSANMKLPFNGTIKIYNNGNEFAFDGQNNEILVNGTSMIKFAVILSLHILFGIVVFFVAIPAALALDAARDIVVLIGRPAFLPKTDKHVAIIRNLVVLPLTVVLVILGAVVTGNAPHFTTPHEILGLLLTLLTLLSGLLNFARAPSPRFILFRTLTVGLLLAIAIATLFTGFADLSAISMCLTSIVPTAVLVLAGSALTTGFAAAMGVVGLRWWVGKWVATKPRLEKADIRVEKIFDFEDENDDRRRGGDVVVDGRTGLAI